MSGSSIPLSLIVPVHADALMFARCLAAIGRTSPEPAEVLVVCDGEAPEAARLARAQGCRLIEVSGGPLGPARARNDGARAAQQPLLFFVDSDVELSSTAIAQVWEHFERDPSPTAVFGSYDAEPSESSFLSQYRNLLHHFVHQTSSARASTFWSGCGAIRREAFLAASGFDETYLEPSIEDIELGYRLARGGHTILLDKTLQVKHLKRWRLWPMLRTDVLLRALPWATLVLEKRGGAPDLNLQASSQWSVIAVFAMLAGLLGAVCYRALLWPCLALSITLILLNRRFYGFLTQKRGAVFAMRAIPCHWLFFACGGFGFGLALLRHLATSAGKR